MLLSMTGFGRAEKQLGDKLLVLELRAVNSRFLEFIMRFPRGYEQLEDQARSTLQKALSRGRVTVSLSFSGDQLAENVPVLNESVLKHYAKVMQDAAHALELDHQDVDVMDLLNMPDVIALKPAGHDAQTLQEVMNELLTGALQQLNTMRAREGQLMEESLLNQIDTLSGLTQRIAAEDRGRLDEWQDRLRQKLKDADLLKELAVDDHRLEQELIIWSDKLDISEEVTRMGAHLQHFRDIVAAPGDSGKRLNFLLQEMNREANTMGSKANAMSISHLVVELKNEIERVREQVQNIQ